MISGNWTEAHHLAVLEGDGWKMPERIVAARQAINDRLQELSGDPDHHAEKQQIEDARRALVLLEAEATEWPGSGA